MSALTDRFDAICERLGEAVRRSGREPDSVALVAVSKRHGPEKVAELARHWADKYCGHGRADGPAGRPVAGESYLQEAREKIPQVRELLRRHNAVHAIPDWHFVGHIQSRKAKDIAGQFSLIHSVDSVKVAEALAGAWRTRVAGAPVGIDDPAPVPQQILIQVNVGREAQKSGVDPDGLEALLLAVKAMPELEPRGLMCLPPLAEIGDASRPYFVMLRSLRDSMEAACDLSLPHLSMGMSDDFEAAIEEGATLVRIGTDIFGPRD